jgi:signal transduction histidine kinase
VKWRATAVDVLVAAIAFFISAAVLAASDPVVGVRTANRLGYALLALYSASVVIRRRAPVAAVYGGLVVGIAYAAANYPAALTPIVVLPVYTAASVRPQREARRLLIGAVLLSAVGSTLGPGPTNLSAPILVASAWLLGNYVGSRRTYAAELELKNQQLERAQLELADRAVTEERLRIARELHDVVAHTMGVVAVHAGTGRMVAKTDPAAAEQALVTIETATRSALVEMRQLLGVLRSASGERVGPREPAPGLRDLDALVAEVVKSGVTVEVRIDGDRPAVPAGVDLSAYRVVQEALTNVIKHAGRTRAVVAVRYSKDQVTIEVDDDGAARGETRSVPAPGGHGLVGMRERVAMYDGEVEAGPRPDGGFRVAVRMPFGEAR